MERMLSEQEEQRIEYLFTYHPPKDDQPQKYEAIRGAAKEFGLILLRNTVPGADQEAMIRQLRETVMTANASVALEGRK